MSRKPTPASPKAQVLAVTYYGHDASIILSLDPGAKRVATRVAGHMAPQKGAQVSLSVEGGVMAYPCMSPRIDAESSIRLASPRPRTSPKRAFVQTIKERQA